MKYKQLGRSGLKVSALCLGTMNFGPRTSEAESFAIMDQALDKGINFLDSANVYGGREGKGVTEEIIGNWIAQGDGRREKIVLATKVYGRMSAWPNDSRLSAKHIRKAVEDSLERLQTDYIDLYQMHHIDRQTPWEEIWQAMETLVQQGKILYVGSSNFAGWHIAQAQEKAEARHFLGLVSEQCKYSLRERSVEEEILPACEAYGLGVIPWSPLSYGILGGTKNIPEGGRRSSNENLREIEALRSQLDAYEALCDDLGYKAAEVAIAWLLKNPAVTAPIIGPRTVQQLEENLASLDVNLDDEAMMALDKIWPGPGGPAPESFAW